MDREKTTDPCSAPPSTTDSSVIIPPRHATLPPGADVPQWATAILRRYDEGQTANQERFQSIQDLVVKRFDALRTELIEKVEDVKVKQEALARRVAYGEFTRGALPIVSLTASIIAVVMCITIFCLLTHH